MDIYYHINLNKHEITTYNQVSTMTSDETRKAVNEMAGRVIVKENEDITGYASCMWCKQIMPIVKRRINPDFDSSVCAGCNASYK